MAVRMIVDTDIGDDIDDTWALAYLLARPEAVQLQLLLTSYGDPGRHRLRAGLLAKLCTAAGRSIPIGLGVDSWGREGASRPECAQAGWEEEGEMLPGQLHEDGVAAMADLLRGSSSPVTVLAIAPLCNLAALITRFGPELLSGHRLVGMHGSIRRGYAGRPDQPDPEHNVACDPAAAELVLRAPWAEVLLCPLDTCGMFRLTGPRFAAVARSNRPLARAAFSAYQHWTAHSSSVQRHYQGLEPLAESTTLFDAVAAELALSDELLPTTRMRVRVTPEGLTLPSEAPEDPELECALDWTDGGMEKFEERLVAALVGPGMCFKCREAPIEYVADPCRCPVFCRRCAMKMATGGKCKVCGQMFGSLRRLVP